MMKLGVINYGGGNLRSLVRALQFLGHEPHVVSGREDFAGLTHLAFPGQGSFGDSMMNLRARGLEEPLKDWLAADRPFFGICIGYQLLFEGSDESPGVAGLGVFKGRVQRFSATPGLKIPHMGWNTVTISDPKDRVWNDLPADPYFYFVHSYFPHPEDSSVIASTTDYGGPFASSVRQGQLFATQFHPEKSQHTGLQMLRNFLAT